MFSHLFSTFENGKLPLIMSAFAHKPHPRSLSHVESWARTPAGEETLALVGRAVAADFTDWLHKDEEDSYEILSPRTSQREDDGSTVDDGSDAEPKEGRADDGSETRSSSTSSQRRSEQQQQEDESSLKLAVEAAERATASGPGDPAAAAATSTTATAAASDPTLAAAELLKMAKQAQGNNTADNMKRFREALRRFKDRCALIKSRCFFER